MIETAIVIIEDDRGRFCLQLRDNIPTIKSPNQWGFFGGGCEPNEAPFDAAMREIEEELTLRMDAQRLAHWRTAHFPTQGRQRHVFHYRINQEEKQSLVVMEGQRHAFATLREVAQGELDGCLLTAHHRRFLLEFAGFPVVGETAGKESAIAIIENSEGRIALQLRDDYDWIYFPNQWGLFGGGCDAGELSRAAIKREIAEELSIVPHDQNLTYWRLLHYPGIDYLIHVFHYQISKKEEAAIELLEGQRYAFIEPDQLRLGSVQNKPIAHHHRDTLLRFLDEAKSNRMN